MIPFLQSTPTQLLLLFPSPINWSLIHVSREPFDRHLLALHILLDSGGHRSLACCSPWGCKESEMTQQLNDNKSVICLFSRAPKSADGDSSLEIKRHLLLGRTAMTNLDSILKSRDITTLLTKVHIVKAVFFPVVMYTCESQTIKKAECQRIDAFELWYWRRLLRVPWTARRSNQSILKEINPEYSLEGLMLKLQYFGHLM